RGEGGIWFVDGVQSLRFIRENACSFVAQYSTGGSGQVSPQNFDRSLRSRFLTPNPEIAKITKHRNRKG
ncbi:MAG: hypothetical protein ACK5ES_02310, partial [Planctomyces sp.]